MGIMFGKFVARGTRCGSFDVKSCRKIHTLDCDRITSVAVSEDKKYIISDDNFGGVRVWCLSNGKLIFSFEGHTFADQVG